MGKKGKAEFTREELAQLLSGARPNEDWVKRLLEQRTRESVLLDYKSGKIWTSGSNARTKVKRTIQEYVASFANAEGGVLILGAVGDEPTEADEKFQLAPIPHPEDLTEWIRDLLKVLRPYVTPDPRVTSISVEGGQVVVVAVGRAPLPVYLNRSGQPAYFLRTADSTVEAPPYLVADLILNRRARPRIRVHDHSAAVELGRPQWTGKACLQLQIVLENDSLTTATDVWAGVVCPTDVPATSPSNRLLDSVSLDSPGVSLAIGEFHKNEGARIRPFEQQSIWVTSEAFPRFPGRLTWSAGLVVRAENLMPQWYQVSIDLTDQGAEVRSSGDGYRFLEGTEPAVISRRICSPPRGRPSVALRVEADPDLVEHVPSWATQEPREKIRTKN